ARRAPHAAGILQGRIPAASRRLRRVGRTRVRVSWAGRAGWAGWAGSAGWGAPAAMRRWRPSKAAADASASVRAGAGSQTRQPRWGAGGGAPAPVQRRSAGWKDAADFAEGPASGSAG